MKIEETESAMTDDSFMISLINKLTSDLELQIVLLEESIEDNVSLLKVDEQHEESNFRFETSEGEQSKFRSCSIYNLV
jgi:hypothetical protein